MKTFTLIEIMLVVAIIAIVATLLFFKKTNSVRRALYLGALKFRTAFAAPVQFRGVEFANIGEGTYEHGIRSYQPDASTTSRYLLYKRGSDADHCALCGAGDDPLGPSDDQADVNGPKIAIKLLGAIKGTVRVVTDGTVNDGDYVKCGANGLVTQAATTNLSFGRALISTDTSKAANDVITIIPSLPAKYAF